MRDNDDKTDRIELADPLAIVAIGSAAGGLKALERLFKSMPENLGIAYVVAQHLKTDGTDVICDVIERLSPIPVVRLTSTPAALHADHVYVAPEQCLVELSDAGLVATETEAASRRAALIDGLFQSLATTKTSLVGVVLSGEGIDGTLGLKAISDAGGMTIAQDADSCAYDEMPRSAALAGHADHVLPPEKMPALLQDYIEHLAKARRKGVDEIQRQEIESILPRICDVLVEATDHDFRRYKTNTLIRRISRRMQVLRLASANSYLQHIKDDREESHTLFQDLLISVTQFFRDEDVFVALANLVIPKLIDDASKDRPIRIWAPGCATGEEAYSLAILLRERLDEVENASEIEVQLFATDIDRRALNIARAATYPLSISEQMSEQRLKRFFQKSNNQYTVVKEIRDFCVFSVHNLVSDPPYSQMDLISCRNLLIYLGRPLQLKLIPLFHFALRPGGYLLLGPSESLAIHTEIFRPVDQRHRISQRKPGPAAASAVVSATGQLRNLPSTLGKESPNENDVHQISQRIVLDEFSPRYAVVNEDAHLVCSSTGLERYFEFPDGPFQNNVVKMARPGLRSGLRTSLRESQETFQTVTRSNLTLKSADGVQLIELVVQPMPEIGEQTKLFMLVFRDLGSRPPHAPNEDFNVAVDTEGTIVRLERELDQTRTDLEAAVQDVEGSNEALKASNEELLSMNEELLSANEELKTSKEEVQTGMEALSRTRNDLENLLDGTRIATIFLDERGRINRFNASSTDIYNLKEGDIGRPLSDITHHATQMLPLPDVQALLQSGEPIEDEVHVADGRWFMRRVLPFRRADQPSGVILTFVDISDQQRTAVRLAVAHDVTQLLASADSFDQVAPQILEAVRSNLEADFCALWLIDSRDSKLYCDAIVTSSEKIHVRKFAEASHKLRLGQGEGLPGKVWETKEPYWIEDATDDASFLRSQVALDCKLVGGAAMPIKAGRRFLGVIEFFADRALQIEESLLDMLRDVGHEIGQFIRRNRLDERIHDEQSRKAAILEAALDCIITMDIDGNVVDFNASAERTFQRPHSEVVGQPLAELIIPEEMRDAHREGLKRFLKTGKSEILGKRIELTALRGDGTRFPIELAINASQRHDGTPFFTAYLRDITDRKQWERELADREAHLRRVIDNMIGFVGVLDQTGTLLEANAAALKSGGVTRDEVIGKKFWDCYWWSYDPVVASQLQEAVLQAAAGELVRYDVTVRMAENTRMIIDFMLVPVRDDRGQVKYLIPSAVDISGRKRTEMELVESKAKAQRLADVVERSNDFIGIATPEGQVLYVNAAGRHMVGLDADFDVTQTQIIEYIAEEDRELMLESALPEFKRDKRWVGEIRFRHWKSNALIPTLWNAFVVKYPDGPVSEAWVTISPNLTEQQKLESALRESEQRMTMALKAGGMAAWEWTPERSVWADDLFELLGLPSDARACPETFFECVHEDDLPGLKDAWTAATTEGQPYAHEFRIRRADDGDVRWLAAAGNLDRNAAGEVSRIFGLNWDVTHQRHASEALKESERRAQEANLAKSEFIANMSHEIRTPMTAVLGYADLLAAQEHDAERSEYVQIIKRNGKFLLDILNDILDLSKIEAGKLDITTEKFSLPNLVADVHSTMNVRAREKGLDFQVEYDGEIPEQVESDPKRVRQILVNLVGNAIKFTEKGRVRLVIRYLRNDTPHRIQFEVIDTGIGISKAEQARLFQVFSQADASVSRKFGGSGLGLAISQRLAHLLGGNITLTSTPGVGSTFIGVISAGNIQDFPLIKPSQDSYNHSQQTPIQRSDRRLKCRVLVVDDRRDVRFLTRRILADAGAEVSLAEDGIEALQLVGKATADGNMWDLILLDMQMPRLDGYQTAAKLREMHIEQPIIAITADAMHGDMDLCLQSGCNAYLCKPIDAKNLVDTVAKYTRK